MKMLSSVMCCEQLQLVWLLVLEARMVVNLAEGLVETRQYTTGLLKLYQKNRLCFK